MADTISVSGGDPMKMIFLSIGFLAGVVFATKYPYMADTISVWVQTNPFLTGLMR
jgi:hypothetical protein